MIDKYEFDSLEGFLFVCFKASEVHVTALKMCQQLGVLEVPGSSYSEKAFYAKEAFVVFLLLLFPLEIWISL